MVVGDRQDHHRDDQWDDLRAPGIEAEDSAEKHRQHDCSEIHGQPGQSLGQARFIRDEVIPIEHRQHEDQHEDSRDPQASIPDRDFLFDLVVFIAEHIERGLVDPLAGRDEDISLVVWIGDVGDFLPSFAPRGLRQQRIKSERDQQIVIGRQPTLERSLDHGQLRELRPAFAERSVTLQQAHEQDFRRCNCVFEGGITRRQVVRGLGNGEAMFGANLVATEFKRIDDAVPLQRFEKFLGFLIELDEAIGHVIWSSNEFLGRHRVHRPAGEESGSQFLEFLLRHFGRHVVRWTLGVAAPAKCRTSTRPHRFERLGFRDFFEIGSERIEQPFRSDRIQAKDERDLILGERPGTVGLEPVDSFERDLSENAMRLVITQPIGERRPPRFDGEQQRGHRDQADEQSGQHVAIRQRIADVPQQRVVSKRRNSRGAFASEGDWAEEDHDLECGDSSPLSFRREATFFFALRRQITRKEKGLRPKNESGDESPHSKGATCAAVS